MSLKVTDVLSRYGGCNDVSVWLKQAHLAKELLKLEDLAVVIPLFLDGPAFAVYEQLRNEDKKDAGKIEAALVTAFATDMFLAYDDFRARMWKPGESVDMFLADLKRLAGLANINTNGGDQRLIKLAFVMGLLETISAQLRATPNIDNMLLEAILQVARALMSNVKSKESTHVGAVGFSSSKPLFKKALVRCFICDGPHYKRNCPKIRTGLCFYCNKPGHTARNCNFTGNDEGALPAPTLSPNVPMA